MHSSYNVNVPLIPKSNFFQAPPAIQAIAAGIRVTQGYASDVVAIKTCAMPLPGMVFQIGQNEACIERIVTSSHTYSSLPSLFVHGARLEPSSMYLKPGSYTTFQVAFYPWALRTAFGMQANLVITRPLGPESFGAVSLEHKLLATDDTASRVHMIEEFLEDQLAKHGQRDAIAEEAVAYIDQNIASITVQNITAHLGITNRLLQKRFSLFIGCSPQKFIQVKRMNMALHLMWTGQYQKLSDIAHALNYYDQAHFIRDIRTFSWLSPKAITQSVTDFRQDESGIAYV